MRIILSFVSFLLFLNTVKSEPRQLNQYHLLDHEDEVKEVKNQESETCHELFDGLDFDGNGILTKSDLQSILSLISIPQSGIDKELGDLNEKDSMNVVEFCAKETTKKKKNLKKRASSNGDEVSEEQSSCNDDPVGWYDADGPQYDCAWYGSRDKNCDLYGDSVPNFGGRTANEACCACGGGSTSGGGGM